MRHYNVEADPANGIANGLVDTYVSKCCWLAKYCCWGCTVRYRKYDVYACMSDRFYTTLGEVGVTIDGSNSVCENVCRDKLRPDHAHETVASTDPLINPA